MATISSNAAIILNDLNDKFKVCTYHVSGYLIPYFHSLLFIWQVLK